MRANFITLSMPILMILPLSDCGASRSQQIVPGVDSPPRSSAERRTSAAEDKCDHFPGQRLYASVIQSEAHEYIFVYKARAHGSNVPPLCEVTYENIDEAEGLTIDRGGRLWVSSYTGSGNDQLLVFPAHADGNVQPVQIISGSNTLLSP